MDSKFDFDPRFWKFDGSTIASKIKTMLDVIDCQYSKIRNQHNTLYDIQNTATLTSMLLDRCRYDGHGTYTCEVAIPVDGRYAPRYGSTVKDFIPTRTCRVVIHMQNTEEH
jgi:hypothetical protein